MIAPTCGFAAAAEWRLGVQVFMFHAQWRLSVVTFISVPLTLVICKARFPPEHPLQNINNSTGDHVLMYADPCTLRNPNSTAQSDGAHGLD